MIKRLATYVVLVLVLVASLTISGEIEAAEHLVVSGECLSQIGDDRNMDWRGIAEENDIVHPYIIYIGQTLKIPEKQKQIVKDNGEWEWKNHGSNPYYRPAGGIIPVEVAEKGIKSFRLMSDDVKNLFSKEIKSGRFEIVTIYIDDRYEEMFFGNSGIVDRVVVAEKNEGARRYAVKHNGNVYYLDDPFVCHNLSWKVIEPTLVLGSAPVIKTGKVLPLPEFYTSAPPMPPKPPELLNKPLQAFLEVLYKDLTCRDCQVDLSGGGVWQDYSDGAQDYTDWVYAAVRCHVWTDKYGNKHKPGLYINGNRWEGDWKERFDFEGEILTFGIEHRVETPDGQEYIFRLGYQDRKESGESSDIWGKYRTDYSYTAIVIEAEIDDTSRINEQWFPRWKFGLGLVLDLSSERQSTWTNAVTGLVNQLNEEPDEIGGIAIKGEIDFYHDRRNIITLSAEFWHNFLFDGDMVTKGTPYIGFLGDSLKIGYQFTNRDTNGSSATGNGLAWQVHLYDLYRYIRYKGWVSENLASNDFDDEDPFSALVDYRNNPPSPEVKVEKEIDPFDVLMEREIDPFDILMEGR